MKNISYNKAMRRILLCAAALLTTLSATAATTLVIVDDAFTTSSAVVLNGRTPTVSLASTQWVSVWLESTNANSQPYLHADGRLRTRFNGAGYINISSAGAYEKPEALTISADLTVSGQTGGNGNGVGLGFFSASPAQPGGQSTVGFTGLVLAPNGNLNLLHNGTYISTYSMAVAAFSASTTYSLSYSINTSNGSLTNILFNGVDISGTSNFTSITGVFTDTATVYAGFFGSSSTYGTSGMIDNFQVSTVIPEAGATWLIPLAFAFVFAMKRRRR